MADLQATAATLVEIQGLVAALATEVKSLPAPRVRKKVKQDDSKVVYGSCDHCKTFKLRCDNLRNDTQPCKRCESQNRPCTYSPNGRPGRRVKEHADVNAMTADLQHLLSQAFSQLGMSPPPGSVGASPGGSNVASSSRHKIEDMPASVAVSNVGVNAYANGVPAPYSSFLDLPTAPMPMPLPNGLANGAPSVTGTAHTTDDEISESEALLLENPLALLASCSVPPAAQAGGGLFVSASQRAGANNAVDSHFSHGIYPVKQDADPMLDPINLGILSERDADRLLKFYYERFRTHVYQLDPSIHTLAYLRATSPFLLSSLCAAAAQYDPHAGSFAVALSEHAVRLSLAVTEAGWKSIEVVQALCILAHWASPSVSWETDRCWTWVGQAIRIATEIRLDSQACAAPLPGVQGSRELLNIQKCWVMLFCVDVANSVQTGRARSIVGEDKILNPTPYPPSQLQDGVFDELYHPRTNVALRQVLIKSMSFYNKLQLDGARSSSHREVFVLFWTNELEKWNTEWPIRTRFVETIYLSTRITLLCHSLHFRGPLSPILAPCKSAAAALLELLSKLGEVQSPVSSNVFIQNLSYTATVLLKLLGSRFARHVEDSKQDILAICRQTIEILQKVARGRLHSKSFATLHAARLRQMLDQIEAQVATLVPLAEPTAELPGLWDADALFDSASFTTNNLPSFSFDHAFFGSEDQRSNFAALEDLLLWNTMGMDGLGGLDVSANAIPSATDFTSSGF